MEIPSRRQYTIFNYATYDFAAHIPLAEERRYFNNILTGITHPCSMLGDGVSRANQLPFLEIVNIETAININIGILEITGNRVSIHNSAGGDIVITTGGGTITLPAGYVANLKYNGVSWSEDPEITGILRNVMDSIEVTGNITIDDNNYDQKYRIQGAHTITLPTVADNEGIELFFWNEGNHAAIIDGEGAETITFQHGGTASTITFAREGDWIRLKSDGTTWICTGGYWGYTTGAAVTADAGGAYVDSEFNYVYFYENGIFHWIGWGYVHTDASGQTVNIDITSPVTWSSIMSLQVTYNGNVDGSDPASLIGLSSNSQIFATGLITDSTSFNVMIRRRDGNNLTNGRRHSFSMDVKGII